MNTFKSISLAALLGASLVSGPALAADRSAGFVAGAMDRSGGITLPAPVQRGAASAQYGASLNAAPDLVLGSYVRGEDGRVVPVDASTATTRAASAAPSATAASVTPADERLFGTFVRHDGIALPATASRGATLPARDADAQTLAAGSAR